MSLSSTEPNAIFRENALKNLNSANDIHQALRVVDAKSITYLIAALLFLSGIITWAVWGEVSIEVPASGILLSKQQIVNAEQLDRELRADHENIVDSKKRLLAKKQMLYDKHYLTIEDIERAKQELLDAKDNRNNYSRLNQDQVRSLFSDTFVEQQTQMEALVFVSHAEGKKIAKGMRVYLLPSTLSSYEYGYIKGRVESVSGFPATKESVLSYLGNTSLVDEYFSQGSPFVVKISLNKLAKSASGLSWTTSTGSPFQIEPGSMVSARIINRAYHPYQFLMKLYMPS